MTDPQSTDSPKLQNQLASKLNSNQPRAQSHAQKMAALLAQIHAQEAELREGGGAKAIESQHAKKRLTARERLDLLLDPGTEFFELGLFAAFGMYEEWAAHLRPVSSLDWDGSAAGSAWSSPTMPR